MRAGIRERLERLRKKQDKSPTPHQAPQAPGPSRLSASGGSQLQIPDTSSAPSVAPDATITSNDAPNVPASVDSTSVPHDSTDPPASTAVSSSPQVLSPQQQPLNAHQSTFQPPKFNHQAVLWDRAYDELKSQEPELVNAYEKLLSVKIVDIDASPNEDTTNSIDPSSQKRCSQMRKVAELGLEKTKRSTAIHDKINGVMEVVYPLKKLVDRVVPVVPQAAVPWAGVSLAFEILVNPFKEPGINREGLMHVISMMNWYINLPEAPLDDNSPEMQVHLRQQLEDHILDLYQKLLSFQIKSVCCFYKNGLKVFLRNVIKLDDWKSQIDGIETAEAKVLEDLKSSRDQSMVDELQKQSAASKISYQELQKVASLIHGEIYRQEARDHEVDNRECRKHLYLTDPSRDKERILESKGTLLRESYHWIIEHPAFQDWQNNEQHRRLWIKGGPGKGKTMLLCGIIEELEKNPFSRICYFFCQATEEKLSSAEGVLRGLMYHLVVQYPWLIKHVRGVYDNSGESGFVDHNSWETLCKIFESMLGDERLDQVTIIVDALDECLGNRLKLLKLIQRISAGSRAKLVVSSRPSQDIEGLLESDDEHAKTLPLELNDDLISNAVERFIGIKVDELEERGPYNKDKTICTMVRDYLTKNANSTFLWVALVCQELSSWKISRKDHVERVLEQSPPGLDELYNRMLDSIKESLDHELCIEVLAANSVVKRPVTLGELHRIIDPSMASKVSLSQLQEVVNFCGSFLLVQDDVVYFVHLSAVDFLVKAGSPRLPCLFRRHHSVFRNSLQALQASKSLKRDIYGLENPAIAQSDIKPPEVDPLMSLHYSCVYWIDHLCARISVKEELEEPRPLHPDDVSEIHAFFKSKFLFWIEAVSLLRHTREAVVAIQQLEKLTDIKSNLANQDISEFIHDANRFLLYYREVIESHPLQLYATALVFSPQQSIVSNTFRNEAPSWVKAAHGLDATWDACLQTLIFPEEIPLSLAYSPDGQWIVSGSEQGTVKLWHADSGTCIHTVGGHGSAVESVAFSADGQSFVSGSLNGVVKVWNVEEGSCSSQHQAHPFQAYRMTISSDGCTFAYVIDADILTYSTKTGIPSRRWENAAGYRSAIALNADGQWLASASVKGIVIRNMLTGESEQTKISDSSIYSLSWSADSQWIASGGLDLLQIWERKVSQWTLKVTYEIPEEDRLSHALAFSTEKKFLASSCQDHIYVWNTATGAVTWKVVSPSAFDRLSSLSFSPDSRRLASASGQAVKIWDLSIDQKNVSSGPGRALYGFDESHMARFSFKTQSIGLWDTAAQAPYKEFQQVGVTALAISKECHRLASASGSYNPMIRVWNTKTGEIVQEFCHQEKKEEGRCDLLAFGDRSYLASSTQESVKVWDIVDGHCLHTINTRSRGTEDIMFSKDARLMACAWSHTDEGHGGLIYIDIWDTVTWRPVSHVSQMEARYYAQLSFSKDSQQLLSSSSEQRAAQIHIWDVESGTLLRQFRGDSIGSITAVFDLRLERRIHTQYGFFDIPEHLQTSVSENSVRVEKIPPFSGYGLSIDLEWILLDGSRLLWIPPDYRGFITAHNGPLDGSSLVIKRRLHGPILICFTA